MRLRSTNLGINDWFGPFCAKVREVTKQFETPENMSLGSNGVDRVRSLQKIPTRLHSTNMCINDQFSPFCAEVRAVTKRSKTPENMSLASNGVHRVHSLQKILFNSFCTEDSVVTKWSEMPLNFSFGSNRVDRVRSLQNILTRLRSTN
jgi:hypothetical protein